MRTYLFAILTILFVLNICYADPIVPTGFVVEKIMDRIDGQTPRLEAISNPEYGYGIIAASLDKTTGILSIYRISASNLDLLGVQDGYPVSYVEAQVHDIKFDQTGLFSNELYLTVSLDSDSHHAKTDFVHVSPLGKISKLWSEGSASNELTFLFAFTDSNSGFNSGAYLLDGDAADGTSLWYMNTQFDRTHLYQNFLPSGRTDLDVCKMTFDTTGLYGNYLTLADTDINHDNWSVIYQLLPDLSWRQLTSKVRTSVRQYRDMCFSSTGSFGPMLYVTERVSDTVMTADPNGIHEIFASNFNDVESITIDGSGEFMYVSDYDGIWRIRSGTIEPGPQLIMQEPKVPYDDVFTGASGVSSVRFLWNEAVQFTNADVGIINENGQSVPLSVSGSGSQFMIVAFGSALLNDKYTLTIKDTAISVETGNAIDGDKNGITGGNAIIVLEHRTRHDSDNDNDVDLADLAKLAEKWLWTK